MILAAKPQIRQNDSADQNIITAHKRRHQHSSRLFEQVASALVIRIIESTIESLQLWALHKARKAEFAELCGPTSHRGFAVSFVEFSAHDSKLNTNEIPEPSMRSAISR